MSDLVERQVFDVDHDSLLNFSRMTLAHQKTKAKDLVQTSNTSVLLKFCDVCKSLNLDPMNPHALHVVVIFMSKSKHCKDIADHYTEIQECKQVIENMDVPDAEFHVNAGYVNMLNSMADWLTLFSYMELQLHKKHDHKIQTVLNELEKNTVIQRMIVSLTEAQVRSGGKLPQQNITPVETAVLAFLYLSPRTTPAGKMLERLYTEINENPRDAELRCLRAMTSFKDTSDDENAYTDAMQLVLRSFAVREDFVRSISAVLRKRLTDVEENVLDQQKKANARPLLRSYVQEALANKQKSISQDSWIKWQLGVNFQNATSSHLQRLLYFIAVQSVAPEKELYECYYTADICNRCRQLTVDVIDASAIIMVIDSLRLYKSNLKTLIDFSGSCLRGVNQKTRQTLSLVQILQLYIAIFQHETIWKDCWKHILPFMNHTIMTDVKRFKEQFHYDINAVVENLVHSLVDEK
jgi:hypothetical protein